jgi:hypothetical protein
LNHGQAVRPINVIPNAPHDPQAYSLTIPGRCRAEWSGASLLGMLASVTDPRSPQGIQHALQFVLAVCVVAAACGDTDDGRHRPIYAATPGPVTAQIAAAAGPARVAHDSRGVLTWRWSMAT